MLKILVALMVLIVAVAAQSETWHSLYVGYKTC